MSADLRLIPNRSSFSFLMDEFNMVTFISCFGHSQNPDSTKPCPKMRKGCRQRIIGNRSGRLIATPLTGI